MKTYTATYNGKDKTEQAQFQAHNLKEAKSHAQFYKRRNIDFTCQTIVNVNK